jgi:NAD(P)H-hydrate epimerase
VLVFAGEPSKGGAAVLAATAALRAGAGLVTLVARDEHGSAITRPPELMAARLIDDSPAQSALELARDKQAAVLGPGFGLDAAASELARALALRLPIPTVLDADALTALGTGLAELARAAAPRVLTPHPGEAARLLGTTTERVQSDRYAAAAKLARESACVTVLKGSGTLIAAPGGAIRVCERGTPAMAVAGTGDVLAGTIAALLALLDPFDAAACGVYLHACAGELVATGDRGLFASELANALPRALGACAPS